MKLTHLLLTAVIVAGLLAGCSKKEEPTPQPTADKPTAPITDEKAAATAEEAAAPVTDEKATATTEETAAPETTQKKAAVLEGLTYIKGDAVTFEEGKVYVVEFWATWCPPCKVSIPHLTEIQKQFKDKSVTVIGISNEKADVVKPFVEKMAEKMNYTVAVDTEGKVGNGYMKAHNQPGIPTAFIVDGKGNIAWIGHPDGLDKTLKQVLAEAL